MKITKANVGKNPSIKPLINGLRSNTATRKLNPGTLARVLRELNAEMKATGIAQKRNKRTKSTPMMIFRTSCWLRGRIGRGKQEGRGEKEG